MPLNPIQTVGNFTSTIAHPLLGGAVISMQGSLLDATFITTQQMMDNSKRKALVGGSTIALTNNILAGEITYRCVRISDVITDGDIVLIASTLQALADSVGGTISITYGLNGNTERFTLLGCVVKSCPPLLLAGNDLPEYTVVFSYSSWIRG